jgi:esterase/lipase superfamily enzyme
MSEADDAEALLFIHGFNVAFDSALRRTARLAYDLDFSGPALLYSWPSRGRATDYVADGSNVEWTVFHLRDFLERILLEVGARAVHVIAHGMGSRALVAALRALDCAELERRGAARLRQVVFTAPDIDAATFRDLARTFERGKQAERFTLYASSCDEALETARKLSHYPRAGDSGDGLVVVDGVDTIDASEVETDFPGYADHGEARSVLSDLHDLIGQGIPPDRRACLRPVEHPEGQYWRFQP